MRTTGSKVVKKVATMSLAAGIALAASGCQVIVKPDPDDPSKDVIVDITPADPSNPSTDPGKDKNPSDEPPVEPDYSMYSETLQTVLKSDYYNYYLDNMQSLRDPNTQYFDGGLNVIEAIPYRFLEKKGEDVQTIKQDMIRVRSTPYIVGDDINTLYNRVQLTYDNDNNDYMKQYLIKYKITDQEYEDLKMLYQGKYYQAQMFVQELDNQRDAELVSEFSIYENTYDGLLYECNMAKVLTDLVGGKKFDNFTVLGTSQNEDGTLNFKINLMSKSSDAVSNGQIAEVDLKLMRSSFYSFDNDILYAKDTHSINLVATHDATPITSYNMTGTSTAYHNFIK